MTHELRRYSAAELASMGLKCLPKARESISRRADREHWPYIEESAAGRNGKRRLYDVPAYVRKELGEAEPTPQVELAEADTRLIELAVLALEEWLQAKGVQLEPARKSAIVAVLYKYLRARKDASREDIEQFLRAIAA